MSRSAWGAGLATVAADGSTLDTWYRWLGWGEYGDDAMAAAHPDLDAELGMRDRNDELRNVTIRPTRITVDVDAAPASPEDAYLRLHLLSHRLAAPNTLTNRPTAAIQAHRRRGGGSATGRRSSSSVAANGSSAAATWAGVWYRSVGFQAVIRARTAPSPTGHPLRPAEDGDFSGGFSLTGWFPVSRNHRVTPSP